MTRSACIATLLVCLIFATHSIEAAAPQVILSNGQRVSAARRTYYIRQIQLDPEINDAGQVVTSAELTTAPPGQEDNDDREIQSVVLYSPRKGASVIAQTGDPLPAPNQDRALGEIRSVRLSQDGSVIFEATMGDAKSGPNSRDTMSLWHWRDGKLQLLLVEGERVQGAQLGKITGWNAVVANDGRVTTVVRPAKGGTNASLVVFHDGKVEQSVIGKDAEKKAPGVSFETYLHAAGEHTLVVQTFRPHAGLGGSRVCRVVGDQLQPVVKSADDAPEHVLNTAGGEEKIGSIEAVRVTPSGRVLLFAKPGQKKNPYVLQAILASEANFGALHTIALNGNKRNYPKAFDFQNLMNEPEVAAISDDGYVAFTDPNDQNKAFYLGAPDGKLDKITTMKDLLKGVSARGIWSMSVANGGLVAFEIIADKGEHSIFVYDAKRGVRRAVGMGVGFPGSQGELHRFAKQKDPRTPMTSDGRYVYAWTSRVPASIQPGGVALIDLKK
ncbi:MAG TPA: hypothetical protein VL282_12390 [Tepidisphaeraceae bacterium]|jgi:hypothetical protein|nr:hypothetical protein [Tepidisphaeraceae bacterium]